MKKLFKISMFFVAIDIWGGMSLCHAQQTMAKIYLKTGSIVKGTILSWVPPAYLEVQTADILSLQINLIQINKIELTYIPAPKPIEPKTVAKRAIARESSPGAIPAPSVEKRSAVFLEGSTGIRVFFPTLGFSRAVGLGVGVPGFHGAVCAKVGRQGYLGAGLGVDIYGAMPFVPIYVNARYFLSEGSVVPYMDLGVGYSFVPDYTYRLDQTIVFRLDNRGGLFVNPSLGLMHQVNPNLSICIAAGYKVQSNYTVYTVYPQTTGIDFRYTMGLFNLKLGIGF